MRKKRSANLPLIEVLTGSLIFHLVLGIILGSYVIAKTFVKEPFEPELPPKIEKLHPQKLKYVVETLNKQHKSPTFRPDPITVPKPDTVAIPDIQINTADYSPTVAVAPGSGAGTGSSIGSQTTGIPLGDLNLSIIGIPVSGQKIMILICADRQMMDDAKGSYPAYRLIKEEVARVVGKIPTGYLYNVGYFLWSSVGFANPMLESANPQTEAKILAWSDPINKTYETVMQIPNSQALSVDMGPLGKQAGTHWLGALIQAMKMTPDTIFIMVPRFQKIRQEWTEAQKREAWEAADFTEESLRLWRAKLAEARRLLAERNANRKANKETESMTRAHEIAVRELNAVPPPAPEHFTNEEILETIELAIEQYYTSKQLEPPSINVALFAEKDWEKTQPDMLYSKELFKEVIRLGRGGKIKVIEALEGIKSVVNQ